MTPEIKPKHLILLGAVGLGGYLIYKRVIAPPPAVAPPPALRVTDVSISPPEVGVGESTEITVTVENTTNVAGSAIVSVTVNGEEIGRPNTGTVEPGAVITLTLTWTPPTTGDYRICAEVI